MQVRTVRVAITGRVQGVGYRAWTEAEANTRGLSGWVRNRRDGSVEAIFAGPESALCDMVGACQDGPPAAKVASIEILDGAEFSGAGFSVLPTA